MARIKKSNEAWLDWELTQRAIARNADRMSTEEICELCGLYFRSARRAVAHIAVKANRKKDSGLYKYD